MAHVLVTGASGFIGWHLVAALRKRDLDVLCLVRRTSQTDRLEQLGVRLTYGDVRSRESLDAAVAGAEIVYHLAGLTKSVSLAEMLSVNQAGVAHVAEACAAQSNPPVLLVVSSLAAAGPSRTNVPKCEHDRPEPVSSYGRSKLAGEEAARQWAGELPVSIVRPTVVLGEGDRDGLVMFRMIARRGIHLVPGMGAARVMLVHATDLAMAMIQVAGQGGRLDPDSDGADPSQGIYFVADRQPATFDQLGRWVGQAVGRSQTRVLHIPRWIVFTAACCGEALSRVTRRSGLINLDKYREATAGSWLCSTDRIEQTIGFTPSLPITDRLKQTADWYRQVGWL